jgi:hypothetical protein
MIIRLFFLASKQEFSKILNVKRLFIIDYYWRNNKRLITKGSYFLITGLLANIIFLELNELNYTKQFLFFSGQTAHFEPRLPHFSHKTRHTHTHILPWTNDRPDAETATYTTHRKHNRRTSMPPSWFEPAIPAIERPQTRSLDRATTGPA